MGVLLLLGTRKGMFLLRSDEDRRDWELEGPLLTGWSVFHAMQDPRDGDLYVAGNNFVYGGTVQRSSDLGKTWDRPSLGLPEETGLKLEEVWHVEPGHDSEPDTLFLGATPGALFRSDDKGETWSPVMGLVQHETREQWQPGAGGMRCHSIQIDPNDPKQMYAAISAGAFRTDDGGDMGAAKQERRHGLRARTLSVRLASASTSCSCTRRSPTACGNRTTAASTAPTTGATIGSAWRATGCRAASVSRWHFIRGSRTPPT